MRLKPPEITSTTSLTVNPLSGSFSCITGKIRSISSLLQLTTMLENQKVHGCGFLLAVSVL